MILVLKKKLLPEDEVKQDELEVFAQDIAAIEVKDVKGICSLLRKKRMTKEKLELLCQHLE